MSPLFTTTISDMRIHMHKRTPYAIYGSKKITDDRWAMLSNIFQVIFCRCENKTTKKKNQKDMLVLALCCVGIFLQWELGSWSGMKVKWLLHLHSLSGAEPKSFC